MALTELAEQLSFSRVLSCPADSGSRFKLDRIEVLLRLCFAESIESGVRSAYVVMGHEEVPGSQN